MTDQQKLSAGPCRKQPNNYGSNLNHPSLLICMLGLQHIPMGFRSTSHTFLTSSISFIGKILYIVNITKQTHFNYILNRDNFYIRKIGMAMCHVRKLVIPTSQEKIPKNPDLHHMFSSVLSSTDASCQTRPRSLKQLFQV